ncbi:hypothetical protein BpHYR1_008069 [Brachionus plicatilis]|uniref:Uncharacterized protein n=1 Tax=Brachionus plicatilis TaxID=10195 RepID=A0A3M7T321_BRAPC|nr:hypothetical protein BpHYR1_008069 [Brachionus plicatilis]
MPKIDIFSAIYKIKREWDSVSALTIQRCFRKAGFKGDFLFEIKETSKSKTTDLNIKKPANN